VSPTRADRAPVILLIGTVDTKSDEMAFLRESVEHCGGTALVMDVGVLGRGGFTPDILNTEVAEAAGVTARREHAHVLAVDALPVRELLGIAVGDQSDQILGVGACGMCREAPFTAEVALEAREPFEGLGRHGVSRPAAAGFIDSA